MVANRFADEGISDRSGNSGPVDKLVKSELVPIGEVENERSSWIVGRTTEIYVSQKGIDILLQICYTEAIMWSVQEAAQELGISGQRVRKLLAEGRIKGKKLGGTWVVLKLAYAKKRSGVSKRS